MSNTSYSFKENSHVIDNQGGEKKVMKKILSVALSTAMAFSMFASVAFGADAKLTPQQQFDALKQAGIVTGMPDGSSALEKTLTRAELAKIIVKSIGLEEVNATSYNDKNYANHWARTFIEAATQAGILEGTDATKKLFNPSGNVTVQELAAVLVRALKLEVPTDTNNSASAWAKGYVQAAVDAGFIDASANFTATATRSQAIVAAYAIYEAAQVPTVKSYEVKDSKNVEFTLSNDEVVKVTLEKALEANKETEVTFKTAAGEEITAKITWVVTDATKVESVTANNLKEIVVKFDGDVKKEDAEKVTNYKLDGVTLTSNAVIKVQEDGTSVVINLGKEGSTLTNQKKHQLTVSGINKIATASYDFSALDVTVPEVTDIEILGNKVINVKFSEPVKTSSATTRVNYKVNGFVVNGEIALSKDGKTATLTLYSRLKAGANKLSVSGVQDYANMTIINVLDKEITVLDDTTAPASFTIESATLDAVTVKFDEAVDQSTVKADKIYWSDNAGTVKTTATSVSATDSTFTTYEITFGDGKKLPARETTLYIESASDLYGNTAAKLSGAVNATVDVTRPEILSLLPSTDASGNYTPASASSFDIKFNKAISTSQFGGSNAENVVVKDKDGKVVAVSLSAVTKKDNKNTLTVSLSSALSEGSTYTVEVKNIVDGTALNNKMIPQTFTVTIPEVTAPTVKNVAVINAGTEGTRIQVVYSNAMSLDGEYSILKSDRYMIRVGSAWYLLPTGTTFEPTFDSKAVIITIPADATYDGINKITASNLIGFKVTLVTDRNGNKLSGLTKEVVSGVNSEWGAQVASIITSGDDAAVATANDKVKVIYNRPLQVVYSSDFKVNGYEPSYVSHENVDGKGVVTLTLNSDHKLPAAAVANVTVAANSRTLDLLGNSVKPETISARDGIAPGLVTSSTSTGINVTAANKFVATLNESVQSPLPAGALSAMFVVKTGLAQDTTLVPEVDYTVDIVGGTGIEFTLKKAMSNVQKITVETNNSAMYIFDSNAVVAGDVSKANKVKFDATNVGGVSGIYVAGAAETSIVTAVNATADATALQTELEAATNAFNLTAYNTLTAAQKTAAVSTVFAAKPFTTKAAIQTALNDAVAAQQADATVVANVKATLNLAFATNQADSTIVLPATLDGATIVWNLTGGAGAINAGTYEVTKTPANAVDLLTATITKGAAVATQSFTVVVGTNDGAGVITDSTITKN